MPVGGYMVGELGSSGMEALRSMGCGGAPGIGIMDRPPNMAEVEGNKGALFCRWMLGGRPGRVRRPKAVPAAGDPWLPAAE
jgi:hypothetical protein